MRAPTQAISARPRNCACRPRWIRSPGWRTKPASSIACSRTWPTRAATASRHAYEHTPLEAAITAILAEATELPPKSPKSRSFYDFYFPQLRIDLIAWAAGHHHAAAHHDTNAARRTHHQAAYDLLATTLTRAGGITPDLQRLIDNHSDWVAGNIERYHNEGPGIGNS